MIPERVQASPTLDLLSKVRDLRAAGEDVISFAAGEPDFQTPTFVIEEAYKSMKGGNTRYVSSLGQDNLRKAIAQYCQKRLKASWVQSSNTLVTSGAKQGIFLILQALLEAENEVLIPIPYWVSYPAIVEAHQGKPVFVPTLEEKHFFPTPESLEPFLNPRVKALIFSSPNNPMGTMIQPGLLKELVLWCQKNKVFLLFDEIYEQWVLDPDKKHHSVLNFINEKNSDYIFSIQAFSKSFAMTGWRSGFVVGHPKNIKHLGALQSQMITCVPGFIQEASLWALQKGEDFLKDKRTLYRKRRDLLIEQIKKISGLSFIHPSGAFYLFVNVQNILEKRQWASDRDFSTRLLAEEKVVVLPGSNFGMLGWIRLSFALSEKELEEGISRLKHFCQSS